VAIQERLLEDLKDAMRSGDAPRREALRLLRAEIQREEIESQRLVAERALRAEPAGSEENVEAVERRSLSDEQVVGVLKRLVKRHEDAIEQFQKGNRPDLVAHEQAQLAVIQGYLTDLAPTMDRSEIEARARSAIEATGAHGRGDMGKVMGRLAGELRGKADMKLVNRVVQELLEA
jgi:uncharacterized protein YqeY